MSSRPEPRVPGTPEDRDAPDPAAAPVNPGAWDTRSWTLVDDVTGPRPAAGAQSPAPTGAAGQPSRREEPAPEVVWPEADRADAPALDADGVPLAEPPTGPVRPLARRPAAPVPPPRDTRPSPEHGGAEQPGPTAGPPPRRRARATPSAAPTPAPPAPGTRLPDPPQRAEGAPSADGPPDREPSAEGAPARSRERTPRAAPAGGRPLAARGAVAAAPGPGGSADPVRELMHRHRALCERAVDPLEIAAGLEAHGITDRTAARYRHRDVFSLAEELYVRVPRAENDPPPAAPDAPVGGGGATGLRTVGRALSHLLPGALCAATLAGLVQVPASPPYARPAVAVLGGLAVLAAVGLSLRGLPRTRTAALWACWLLGYALYGDWLLAQLLSVGEGTGLPVPALGCRCVPLAMSIGVAPAAWCAQLFAARARRRLGGSRSLGDFAARVRPLLLLAVASFVAALLAVQYAVHLAVAGTLPPYGTPATTAALGALLFLALLLSAHGFPRAASAGLASACLLVAAALGTVLAARLPGAEQLALPVESAVAVLGPAVVPVVACTLAALPLLGYALRVLAGASAHQRGGPSADRPLRQVR
ncbi:hypothetical protein [Streptomyces sp. TR06-5]|uniref:hypothetical protein n=1 Tax=Streptomyces sp. TR06-5 TaxID=3385976 RepID=UPI0039A14272